MTLAPPDPHPDDPRLTGHDTDYDQQRGGWYPPQPEEEQ